MIVDGSVVVVGAGTAGASVAGGVRRPAGVGARPEAAVSSTRGGLGAAPHRVVADGELLIGLQGGLEDGGVGLGRHDASVLVGVVDDGVLDEDDVGGGEVRSATGPSETRVSGELSEVESVMLLSAAEASL